MLLVGFDFWKAIWRNSIGLTRQQLQQQQQQHRILSNLQSEAQPVLRLVMTWEYWVLWHMLFIFIFLFSFCFSMRKTMVSWRAAASTHVTHPLVWCYGHCAY